MNKVRKVRFKNNNLFVYYQHNFITAPFSYFDPKDEVKVLKIGKIVLVSSLDESIIETHWRSEYEHC